jgi:hypothetical protein
MFSRITVNLLNFYLKEDNTQKNKNPTKKLVGIHGENIYSTFKNLEKPQ